MSALGDLFGASGVIEQLLLYNVAGQVVSAMAAPAFTALLNDAQHAHPEVALTPDVLATLVAHHLATDAYAKNEAAKSGIPATSFDLLRQLATVRLSPDELALATLRSYMPLSEAQNQARPQGYTSEQFALLTDLAGDAPGPQQLAEALRRKIIERSGRGPESTSFDQGISESRLHNKWADMIARLTQAVISPADAAQAAFRHQLEYGDAERQAGLSGVDPKLFGTMTELAGHGPSPQELVTGVRRQVLRREGTGRGEVSYAQGLAEAGIHAKWGPLLELLGEVPLSPADAASAVIRNFESEEQARKVAEHQGVSAETFTILTHLAGDAPGPQQLAEALRRGAIKRDGKGPKNTSFEQGIAEGRLADKWAPVIEAISKLWPTPVDALNALLKGAFPEAEAKRLYEKLGGDLEFFDWLYFSQGEAPTPLELISMANRGFIHWDGTGKDKVTYEQGFHEGRWRNKWSAVYRKFAEYLPAPETVVTLLKDGVLDAKQAAPLFAAHGMSHEMIQAYLDEAHVMALTDYRGATTSLVLNAYHAQLIGEKDAESILLTLHTAPEAIKLMLGYEDIQRAFEQVNSSVSRIRTLYAARKITKATAHDSLLRLKIPAAQVDPMIATWQVENSITVKPLTEAQIADAFIYDIITEKEAFTELENIGYTPFDAWVVLSIKAKTPLPNKPALGPAAPQGAVIPGTT